MRYLADEFVTLAESPYPGEVFCYSPGICRLASGRLVATMDYGGKGVGKLPLPRSRCGDAEAGNAGQAFVSDDHGKSWRNVLDFPFYHARPFEAGENLCILGHSGDLMISVSKDDGESWSAPAALSAGQRWHQAPCNVWYANGKIYLVMERYLYDWSGGREWCGWHRMSLVVMSGRTESDLTLRENWTFSNEFFYHEALPEIKGCGTPFYRPGEITPPGAAITRRMEPVAWLETNIVQFSDPEHIWHDPAGRTFYLFSRTNNCPPDLAMLTRVKESPDGSLTVGFAEAPSGEVFLLVPLPGGQMKFHILYDVESRLFWLLGTQAGDSMIKPERMGADRFHHPLNERRRLQLHFSKNCVNWHFAGLVAAGRSDRESRHYASMAVDGDDLVILCRSGDDRAVSAHNGNLITVHTVKEFRNLIY